MFAGALIYAKTALAYMWYLLVLLLIILFILISFSYSFIVIPYRRIQKTMRLFNQGHTNEQLFQMKDNFCSEMPAAMQRISDMLDKQTAIQMSKKQAEYLALQNQINPHFLYNTLEAIRGDALDIGMDNIAQTTEALATFFRYTITEVENLVTLEDELENVENYFIIQKYRFGEKLNMEIDTGEDGTVLQSQLPKLTLQPIIENAVVHGVEVVKSGVIRLKVYKEGDNIILQVINTGKNMTPEDMERIQNILENKNTELTPGKGVHASLGIRNVNERIKLIYGEEYGLTIKPAGEDETASTITIPSEPVNDTEKQKLLNNLLKQSL
jgi:two-component system sensor histidine kinase YesM